MAEVPLAGLLERVMFAGLAILHLLPVTGVAGSAHLRRLYGVAAETPDLAILLRHRALQFGVLAALSLAAVFLPAWRPAAALALASSMLGFVLIARAECGGGVALRRIARIDGFALLPIAVWAIWKYDWY